MTCIAAEQLPGASVLDLETRRDGPSYSVVTARVLRTWDPEGELWLLCGTDMFLSLDKWYRSDWLLRNLYIAAYPRSTGDRPVLEEHAEVLRRVWGARVEIIDLEPLEVSSTEVRQALKQGRGCDMVGDAVYAYILRSRLYGVRPEPEVLWRLSLPRQVPKRLPHVQGCREEAVRLAGRWGADAAEAERAAILHDVTKGLSIEEQLRLCAEYGIIPGIGADDRPARQSKPPMSPEEFADRYPSVLHAFSGAAVAWGEFGVSPEVRDAIMWHTTGRENMTLLEKLIWLADYIEPNRCMHGVNKVRKLAYQDLNAALKKAMKSSLEHVEERGGTPCPATCEALADLRKKETKT